MPLNVIVTKRKIKNKSGVDISVPSYQKPSGGKTVKDYHVVVISDLPFFKQPEHSEEDVVQFMVLRDYDAFEKLQSDVIQQFPGLKLPNLPRKFHLFLSDTDIEERQMSFDCLMTVLARKPDICTSIPMLQFLGIDLLADRKYYKKRKEYLEKQEQLEKEAKAREEQIIGNFKEGEGDIFGEVVADLSEATHTAEQRGAKGERQSATSDLFANEEQDSSLFPAEAPNGTVKTGLKSQDLQDTQLAKRTVKLSLLGEVDELEPAVLNPVEQIPVSEPLFVDEDHSDLLDIPDTVDDLLQLADKPVKSKKKHKSKPAGPPPVSLFDDSEDQSAVVDMGTDDILKYIQQNQAADDDLELF